MDGAKAVQAVQDGTREAPAPDGVREVPDGIREDPVGVREDPAGTREEDPVVGAKEEVLEVVGQMVEAMLSRTAMVIL